MVSSYSLWRWPRRGTQSPAEGDREPPAGLGVEYRSQAGMGAASAPPGMWRAALDPQH